jgi:hypothetical protein
MRKIKYDEETRTFSVEDILDPVIDPVTQKAKKAKRSLQELVHDIFINPKTKQDKLRRRAAIGFAGTLLTTGLGLKNYNDKNNMEADLDDLYAGKPGKRHTGWQVTLDKWKGYYNSAADTVSDAVKKVEGMIAK